MNGVRFFSSEELLPGRWQSLATDGPVRTFNPGLLRDGDGWIFAYRVSTAAPWRRIGLCRLDQNFNPIAGSAVPLTDLIPFRAGHGYPEIVTRWFADPRLYRLRGRVFVYWNSGWHEPQNHQFVHELDPRTLGPIGGPRELVLRGPRQKLEKNWTLFEAPDGAVRAIYSAVPQRVLALSLDGEGPIELEPLATTEWALTSYPASHGGLRGGAPPQAAHGSFWSICHSVHDSPEGYRYIAAAYRFAANAPFAPEAEPIRPLDLPNPWHAAREHERLNPAVGEVIYPCGAAWTGDRWVIGYGINDERCAIATLEHAAVAETLRPVVMGN